MPDPEDIDLDELPLDEIARAAETCTACELYGPATQVVFGEGPEIARIMLLGEQPGDIEDRAGEPFVGPAGGVLDSVLEEAGIDRDDVYVTNVVKHFRFRVSGEKRIHQTPTRRHVEACRPWLDAELAKIRPSVIVTLGASAAKSLLGSDLRVMADHGVPLEWEDFIVVPTIHPSFVLRSSADPSRRSELRTILVADLMRAGELAGHSS